MPLLYLDCQYGISGDMTLAALIDAGADCGYIIRWLHTLPIDAFVLGVTPVDQQGIQAKMLRLFFPLDDKNNGAGGNATMAPRAALASPEAHRHHDPAAHHHLGPAALRHHDPAAHHHIGPAAHRHHDPAAHHHHGLERKAAAILAMIAGSTLPERVRQRAGAVFTALARAEGKIHGVAPEEVRFHEVGAMDSIIDILGVCLALESLDIETIIASPVATGQGKQRMAHGCYPIPAPATAELLTGIPLADFPVEGELTTPTGAAFLNALVSEFRALPAVTIGAIGYGAGKRRFSHPNILRVFVCAASGLEPERETVATLQCEVDDISGENLGYVMQELLDHRALDVYYTPVYMKKNRPGTLVTVLCRPQDIAVLEEILLVETPTFGVRQTLHTRRALERRSETVPTPYGDIAVKIGYRGQRIYQISPEYEHVRRAAKNGNVPYDLVWGAARQSVQSLWASAWRKIK